MTSGAQEVLTNICGEQFPRLWVVPPRDDESAGEAACRFFETMTGRRVLPWQRLAVIEMMAERQLPDGRWKWAATDVGLIVARQNGKGDVLLIIELYHLFVLKDRRIFHTAQLQRTATDAHKRMATVIRNNPKLLAQVRGGERGIQSGKGSEQIVLADGRQIFFFTRSDNAGRGLYGDLMIFDEAYDLTENEVAALRPLVKTAKAQQIIYTSTPVDGDSMPNGLVLSALRKKALNGGARLTAWLEWSVPERQRDAYGRNVHAIDERIHDPRCWAMANPSLGMVINADGQQLLDAETIEGDINMGARKFLVEDLCAPDWWPDPEEDAADELPFDPTEFGQRSEPMPKFLDPVALALDRSPDGRTALVAAGYLADGRWSTQTIKHTTGTDWVVPAVLHIMKRFDVAVLVLDAAGPAGALVAKLLAAKLDPVVTGISEMGRAAQSMVDDFGEGRYVPPTTDSPINAAVEIARWRDLGDGRAFARKGYGDISPLVAAALAGFGLNLMVAYAKPKTPAPAPTALEAAPHGADWSGGGVGDLANAGF